MHKLCTLKDVVPGSVIEVPKDYRTKKGETAIILGLEYTDKKHVKTSFMRPVVGGVFDQTPLPALLDTTEVALLDDTKLQKSSMAAFVANKIGLPVLPVSSGCDPEIFVLHGDGSIFPAWEYMPSEEEARAQAKEWLTASRLTVVVDEDTTYTYSGNELGSTHGTMCLDQIPAYWDGAQAEFAPWAKTCLETLHFNTRRGLKAVLDFARAKDPQAKLTLCNVIELPEAILRDADNKFIQFRCSQSYNIYNDPGDGIPNAREYKYRCAGGHIHIGYTRKFTAPVIEQIVRGLDGIVGVIGVSLAAGIDNPERRHTYGRAGEFRLPQHGLEYRVLSNFWLCHPAIAMLVFEITRAAVRLAESGLFNLCWEASEGETREVINSCDVEGARVILKRNAPVLIGMLNGIWNQYNDTSYHPEKARELALKTILNGLDVAIKEPLAIEKNWKLDDPKAWLMHCRGKGDSWMSLAGAK